MEVALLGDEAEYVNDPLHAWRKRTPAEAISSTPVTLKSALRAATELAREQQSVMDISLVREYMPGIAKEDEEALSRAGEQSATDSPSQHQRRRRSVRDVGWKGGRAKDPTPPPPPMAPSIMSDELKQYWQHLADNSFVSSREPPPEDSAGNEALKATSQPTLEAGGTEEEESRRRGWPLLSPDQVAASLRDGSASVVDVRSLREWEWGKIKGSQHCPVVLSTGSSMNPGTKPNPDFIKLFAARFRDKAKPLILYGSAPKVDDEDTAAAAAAAEAAKSLGLFVSKALSLSHGEDGDYVATAAALLMQEGYTDVSELKGGYGAWDLEYRPDGRRREKGKWADKSSGELEWWTASN